MYTLDTNAIIYYLKDDVRAVSVLKDVFVKEVPIYISAITEIELFGFSNLSGQEINKIDNILRTIFIVPIDSRIARLAGALRRNYRLKIPDAAIAATAIFTGSTLLTRNIRDFQKIPNLKLISV